MTLSVLLPVYNCNAYELVCSIHRLIIQEQIDGEIIIADDCSPEPQLWLSRVEALSHVVCWHAPQNLGRAAIRNRLANMAHGTWLWFLDADTALSEGFSFSKYLVSGKQAPVLCGGIMPPAKQPLGASLRYRYERADAIRRTAEYRNQSPYRQISTCNLWVRADVFAQIMFDENIKQYGHEDTLFGIQLEAHHIPIFHIDNPVIHLGLESNAIFLRKTETALGTLHEFEDQLRGYSRLLELADTFRRLHLSWLVRASFKAISPLLRRNLLGNSPSLTAFAAYKIGYYLSL